MPRRAVSSWFAGRRAVAVVADLGGEARVVVEAGLHRAHLVHGQAGGARGGDRRARRRAARRTPSSTTQATPSAATARSDHAAVAGRDPGQAKHRQRREDERER